MAGSTICSGSEHCSSGVGGELNYMKRTLDVAGAHFSWALDSSGPKSDWACSGCPNQLDQVGWHGPGAVKWACVQ